jgi:tripartite-type tricarboxylate transporter receptor subunit TctC
MLALMSILVALASGQAFAQAWPQRPIRLILPASAGGNSDILGRILAESLKNSLGQPVVMDYRAGAAGRIAAEAASKAEPDGYTFFMTSSAPHGVVPAMYSKLGYDPVRSFTPVARLATTPNVLYVNKNSPFRTLSELIAYGKDNPGKLNFASAGFGTTMHLSAVLLGLKAGITFTNVPYKGGSEALIGILAGDVDAAFESLPVAKPQIEAGAIRALGITSRQRAPELPDVPTMAEAGLPAVETLGWYGVLAPVGTPQPIIDRMSEAIRMALSDPAIARQLRDKLGAEPAYLPGPALEDFYKRDIAGWTAVVEQAGIPRE